MKTLSEVKKAFPEIEFSWSVNLQGITSIRLTHVTSGRELLWVPTEGLAYGPDLKEHAGRLTKMAEKWMEFVGE